MSKNVAILEVPTFGRPFKLGMLYDATTDRLIQGNELWDKETLQKAQQDKPYLDTKFSVIQDDSLASKCLHLGANSATLKANLFSGLTQVSGAAKFFIDHKTTREVVRVTVQLKCSSHTQEIDLQQLGQIQNQAAISATRATHVVSKILSGLEAFLVIDRLYSADEDISVIQEKITNCAQFLANTYDSGKCDLSEIDQKEAEKYSCKFYSDAPMPTASPSSFKDVVTVLEEHHKLFKQGSSCSCLVPKKVWLYLLSELDSSAPSIAQEVSEDVISHVEKITEDLSHAEVWISDISKNNLQVCSAIPCFQHQQTQLNSLVKRFKSDLVRQLSTVIPNIRNSTIAFDQLSSLLKEVADSPFASENLTAVLKGIEQEIRAVTLCLKSISSIKFASADELESLGYEYDHILCFELRLVGSHGLNLDKMDKYLQTKKISSDSSSSTTPWYKDGSKKRALQLKAKAFKEFSQLNSARKDVAFVASMSTDTSKCGSEVAAIVLYADESPVEFEPPSEPVNPAVTQTANGEATLTWNKPKFGSASILSYTVRHRIAKNPPVDKWIIQNTSGPIESLKVPELIPDCTYEFAVLAESKVGHSRLSNCVTLKISSAFAEQTTTSTPLKVPPAVAEQPTTSTPAPTSVVVGTHPVSSVESSQQRESALMGSQLPLSTMPPYSLAAGPYDMGLFTRSMPQLGLLPTTSEQQFENEPPGLDGNQMQPRVLFPSQLQQWYGDHLSFSGVESRFQNPFMPATARRIPLPEPESTSEDRWKIFSDNPYLSVPIASTVTHKSVEFKWKKPESGQNEVESYTVYYHQEKDPDNTLKKIHVSGEEQSCVVGGLTHETAYVFKLQANFTSGNMSLSSKETDVIETPAYLPETIRTKSKLIQRKSDQQPAIYELTKKPTMSNKEKRVAKYEVGQPIEKGNVRVLMVVGATGAGKTTLINGIANYMYGVQWEDEFRFVLVSNEPSKKSQAYSQTSWITAYTLFRSDDSPINYSLTIIDTPGFGDTEGIDRDKKIVEQIKDFFSIEPPHGIDVLHGIGFVAQASLARLSQSQRYIFDSILSIYGRDVASNIFMMTTFADGQLPPVLEAIKIAKIPHQAYFKFNNSALFVTGDDESFDAMFWKMGVKSFLKFFVEFGRAPHRSLQLTREVLDEREQLEDVLRELQPQINAGLTKMDELQKFVQVLQRNKAMIEQNKDFDFTVKVTKQRKVDTPTGQYTTNCLTCNYTCHKECRIADNAKKQGCWAMDKAGNCRICPDHCIWSKHVNNPYIFVLYQVFETRTSAELKERYVSAKEGQSVAESMIANIKEELECVEFNVLGMVDKARKSLMRLDEIALKPNPLSEVDYIDKLIASEELQHKPGWFERVNAYKLLRKRALLLRKIKKQDLPAQPGGGVPIFLNYLGDESGAAYCSTTIQLLSHKPEKKDSSYFSGFKFWKKK